METDTSEPPLPTDFNTSNFSREEIYATIKSLKNNKAPGVDNLVTAELLKRADDYLRDVLRSLCNKILNGADPPWQWTTNKIVPVPKKGDLSMMTNYRGISRTWNGQERQATSNVPQTNSVTSYQQPGAPYTLHVMKKKIPVH